MTTMKYPSTVIEDWIERICNEGRNLSDWERKFIDSISEQWDENAWLSARQEEILERIYVEKVP